ncbi:MAG TPA: penicillin-binding protein, partial [Actinomycetales bacterium]|nr:penicillin-binding protein [Actinomycetales bacterium]
LDGAEETVTVPLTWTFEMGEDAEPVVFETTANLRLHIEEAPEGATATPEPRWVADWNPTLVHPDATADTRFALSVLEPERADIVDSDGMAIIRMRDVWRVGIDKQNLPVEEQDAAARALATRLEMDPDAFAARVESAGEKAFVVAITIRQEEEEQWGVEGLRQMRGVLLVHSELPLGPTATFARPVLGSIGEATAEIIEKSEGRVEVGDLVGLSGLAAAYEDQLRGTEGWLLELVPAEGVATATHRTEIAREDAADGEPLVVTLDTTMQMLAEELLAPHEGASAIAVVRASDGHVLALASGPGSQGYNTAALGQYAPGSTFKISTALTLMRAGYTPETELECTPTSNVEGRNFTNYPGYPDAHAGRIPLHLVIAYSCNTALINEAGAISAEDLQSGAASLGLGTPGPWAFPYYSGTVPADATGTYHAAALIGQGGVTASPLAMATVAASVAAGHTVVPVLLPNNEQEAAPGSATEALTPEEAGALAEMMRAVVTSGTGTRLADVPGEPVHAKSGTAQWGDGNSIHGWMIAYQGDLAIAAFVEDAALSGSSDAGPIVEEFLRRLVIE